MSKKSLKVKIAVLQAQVKSDAKTLKHQAKEYERRLGILNHESTQLKSMQETYVPKITYEKDITALKTKIETLQKFMWVGIGALIILELFIKFAMK